ncbi:MAG: hypothetical protein Q4F00_04225 [bacterium]|nr:hypothetical protein [bacterium]
MDKVSGSNNNTQVYANQNSAQVQQTDSQARETDSAASSSSGVQEQEDAAEISVFGNNNEDEEIVEFVDLDDDENEIPYTEEEMSALGYADEDDDLIIEEVILDDNELAVSEVRGDEFLQSEEYFQRLSAVMEKQENCQVLYNNVKNTKQRNYIKNHTEDYISMKKNGYDDFYDFMAEHDGITKEEAKAYVESRLQEVKEQYEGRAVACMSALTIMEIAADYGVKLPYNDASTPSHLAKDIDPAVESDCANFVSWALDQAHPDDIYSMNVGQLGLGYSNDDINVKNTKDYTSLQAGDVYTNGSQHAMMIVYNNPEKGIIILAESSDQLNGVQMRELTYEQAQKNRKDGYTGVNASTVYDGTANCYNYGRTH